MNILIYSPVNRHYYTGLNTSSGVAIILDEQKYFLTDFRYIEMARNSISDFIAIESTDYIKDVNLLIKKHNIKELSIEDKYLTHYMYNKLINEINCELLPLGDYLENKRRYKTKEEIQKIITAQSIAHIAFDDILNFISAGTTEKQIKARLIYTMLKNGAQDISFDPIVASGVNGSIPHAKASDKLIQKGEFITLDFGCKYDGYCSDMTRTIALGDISDEMRITYNTVLLAQETAIENIKIGAEYSGIDDIARNIILKSGVDFGHSLGHGIGLLVHENPSVSKKSSDIITVGDVFSIEPGIYLEGKYGVRIEDLIYISDDTYINLTKCKKSLIIC